MGHAQSKRRKQPATLSSPQTETQRPRPFIQPDSALPFRPHPFLPSSNLEMSPSVMSLCSLSDSQVGTPTITIAAASPTDTAAIGGSVLGRDKPNILQLILRNPAYENIRQRNRIRHTQALYFYHQLWNFPYAASNPSNTPTLIVIYAYAVDVACHFMHERYPEARVVGCDGLDFNSDSSLPANAEVRSQAAFINGSLHLDFESNSVDYFVMRNDPLQERPIEKYRCLLQEIYRVLRPGGRMEIFGSCGFPQDMGPYGCKIVKVMSDLISSYWLGGGIPDSEYCTEVGFTIIDHSRACCPLGEWSPVSTMKEIGYLHQQLTSNVFYVISPYIKKEYGWSDAQFQEALYQTCEEFAVNKSYMTHYYFAAEKPL
ncbi:hypothetical protein DM01DRAFT_1405133 [Hesseltinella vesiculosa]|uniref:Methyltransferase domain-containing protein n=1 Tax=Hesseltinella vesiculosa TaxID=101127 RepID=A0A1X2GR46_9FUNG|nr:hypothetical protein DM01DRAFT_1405133 [Hesseltinella vesiculosa]